MGNYWQRSDKERVAYELERIARQSGVDMVSRPPRQYRQAEDQSELLAWICGYHDEDELLTEYAA